MSGIQRLRACERTRPIYASNVHMPASKPPLGAREERCLSEVRAWIFVTESVATDNMNRYGPGWAAEARRLHCWCASRMMRYVRRQSQEVRMARLTSCRSYARREIAVAIVSSSISSRDRGGNVSIGNSRDSLSSRTYIAEHFSVRLLCLTLTVKTFCEQ